MKIAIVTGASSGMGREFVRQLSAYVQVDEIWAIARRQDALETLKAEAPVPVRPVVLDLLEKESFDKIRAMLEAEQPDIRLLVNAAGFGKFGAYHKTSIEEDCRMIDLNCKALLVMTRLCIPYMQPGSHILELDSFRLPARALHHHLRRHQGLCPQLQPGHEPGAERKGHPGHGHEPRLGKNRVFPPRLPEQH